MQTASATTIARYRTPARLLHWLMAVIILGMIPVGIIMGRLDGGPLQNRLYDLHRSFGFVILILVLLRLAYRATHAPPPLPASIVGLQRLAAEVVHGALYLLLVAAPIVGWLATNAYGAPIIVFGMFELPVLLAKSEPLADQLFAIHRLLGLGIGGLVLLHIAGAMVHTFVFKDQVLQRMWPP